MVVVVEGGSCFPFWFEREWRRWGKHNEGHFTYGKEEVEEEEEG